MKNCLVSMNYRGISVVTTLIAFTKKESVDLDVAL